MKVKIKRFCKRVLPVVIAVMALAAVCCVPVSAASSGWSNVDLPFNQWFTNYELDDPNLAAAYLNSSGRYVYAYPIYFLFGDGAGVSRPITGVRYRINGQVFINDSFINLGESFDVILPLVFLNYELSAGDTFIIDFNTLLFGLDPAVLSLNSVTASVLQISGDKDKSFTKNLTFEDKNNNGNYHCVDNSLTVQSIGTSSFLSLSISANVTLVGTGTGSFSFTVPDGLTLGYGNPNSPEAPKYNTPDGSFIEDYTEKEEEILNSTQGGQDEFNSLLANFRTVMEKFGPSMLAATWVFNLLLDEFALSYFLLYFALLTGVAAFVLGVAAWIGRGSRSSSSGSKGSKGKKGG